MKYRNVTNMTLSLGGNYVGPYGEIELDEATLTPRIKLNIKDGNLVELSKAPSVESIRAKKVARDTVSATDVPDAKVERVENGVITVDPDDAMMDPDQAIPGLSDSDFAGDLISQAHKTAATVSAAVAVTANAKVKEPTPSVAAMPDNAPEAISPSEESNAGSFIVKDKHNPMGGTEKSLDEMIEEKSTSVTSAVKTIVNKLDGKKN